MISPFGVEHLSKGLPSSVKAGGGGHYGHLLRAKKSTGRMAAQMGTPASRSIMVDAGRMIKTGVERQKTNARVSQVLGGKAARRQRAELLSEDSAARRKGFKTGKTSALDRGYRGRVSYKMKELP